jgi:hypothetical protein
VTTDSPQSGDGMVTITDAFGREVTILYPDTFADVNIAEKTDEIFTLFVGENVYDHLNKNVEGLAFTKLDIPKL